MRQALNKNGYSSALNRRKLQKINVLKNIKAFLLYKIGITEHIGSILRSNDGTSIFKSYHTIASILPSVKDGQDKLLVNGIY